HTDYTPEFAAQMKAASGIVALEERQYRQAARRLVSCSSMSCRLCACVSLIGCDCSAVCSAPSFLAIEHDIGTSFSDVITQDDTVVYGILCALASLDRQELRRRV